MSLNTQWELGKIYRTRGGLCAKLIQIHKLAVPRDLTEEEKARIRSKPHYGLEGYVFTGKNPKERVRGSWTTLGKHSEEEGASDAGDLSFEVLS